MTVLAECAIWVLGGGEGLTGSGASVPLQPGDLYAIGVKPLHVADEDDRLETWDVVCRYIHCGYNLEEFGDVHMATEGALQFTVSHLTGDLGVE